ncbi:hypothetical protein [Paracoccus thiocyanatus]|uniref:Uncharacterized protein n=1 Tax=Paracoccus thiocyanatus TaxID=34006 RepID=A0A3D8PE84_9RHOB|nr:hypothetical protein [Paracoccus thiocyanatus]RDW14363.1 hypothetical protein DIE28_02955 [Paracoccus thiocyanatus]
MTDKGGARPNRKQGAFTKHARGFPFRRGPGWGRDALMDQVGALLRRVFRDCWWLSAIVVAVVFLPLLLWDRLPGWHDPVAMVGLTLAFGVAVLGWSMALMGALQPWPGFRLGLTLAIPLVMAIRARMDARGILAHSFGVSPDSFPVTLDVLTAITTLWLTFAGVGALLVLLLLGLLVLQMLAGAGAGRTFLHSMALVLPLSTMVAIPFASWLAIMPGLSDLVRRLDGQEQHRCDFPAMPAKPVAVTFLSDTQVLAWLPDAAQPVVLPCALGVRR